MPSRTTINFWLDATLLIVFLALIWASVVVEFVFPPTTTADGYTLWGGDRQFWSDVQFGVVCVLTLGVLVHVMLHWNWVCGVVAKWLAGASGRKAAWDDGVKTLVGVGLIIVVLNVVGIAIAWAALSIREPIW